ncbi:hypothetical protein E2C01_077633 [Portunus trituberculatus]|uniref:Uncharacterized protein n=1 Tax=Portunus trituberculatus TaxID=210409 RepID=A0A5B7IS03_PORTR|nr:hypothetical protein [Portunus trituberculatus]
MTKLHHQLPVPPPPHSAAPLVFPLDVLQYTRLSGDSHWNINGVTFFRPEDTRKKIFTRVRRSVTASQGTRPSLLATTTAATAASTHTTDLDTTTTFYSDPATVTTTLTTTATTKYSPMMPSPPLPTPTMYYHHHHHVITTNTAIT